jgi:hypothetical protein
MSWSGVLSRRCWATDADLADSVAEDLALVVASSVVAFLSEV